MPASSLKKRKSKVPMSNVRNNKTDHISDDSSNCCSGEDQDVHSDNFYTERCLRKRKKKHKSRSCSVDCSSINEYSTQCKYPWPQRKDTAEKVMCMPHHIVERTVMKKLWRERQVEIIVLQPSGCLESPLLATLSNDRKSVEISYLNENLFDAHLITGRKSGDAGLVQDIERKLREDTNNFTFKPRWVMRIVLPQKARKIICEENFVINKSTFFRGKTRNVQTVYLNVTVLLDWQDPYPRNDESAKTIWFGLDGPGTITRLPRIMSSRERSDTSSRCSAGYKQEAEYDDLTSYSEERDVTADEEV